MTGNNTVLLNKATMMKAVQHYFDTVLFREGKSPKVDNITPGLNTTVGTFEITLVSAEVRTP